MTKTRWMWVAAFAAALGLAACGSDSNDSPAPAPAPTPTPTPTGCTPPATATTYFRQDVYPTLTSRCIPCHVDAQAALPRFASIDPDVSYSAVKAEVNTTAPASSNLLVRANGGSGHPDQLSDAQTATITKWIQECAQNNSR